MKHQGTRDTTPFHIFKDEVAKASGLPVERLHMARLHAAYDMGESVWMVADEMKLRAELKPSAFPKLDRICVRRIKI